MRSPTDLGASALRATRSVPPLAALGLLVAAGVLLRALLMLEWRPALLGYSDIYVYIGNSRGGDLWFSDPLRPVGYPLFLAAMRAVSDDLSFTTLVQQALGVGAGIGAWFAGRALGLRPGFALLAPAMLLLHGSTIFFEHTILTEAVFIPAVWGGLVALAFAHRAGAAPARLALCALAGLCVAYAGATRQAGILLLPLAAAWVLWAFPGALRARLAPAVALALSGAALLAGNLVWAHAETGAWAFARNGYYQFYGRVASFVDCSKFTPPEGTEVLCPSQPPSERQGATWHLFHPESPAIRAWGAVYTNKPDWVSDRIKAFSRAAVLNQPLDYLETVARDTARIFAPSFPFNPNPAVASQGAGFGPQGYAVVLPEGDSGGEQWAEANMQIVRVVYDTPGRKKGSIGFLRFWERNTRFTGVPLVVLMLLAAAGVAYRETRRSAALFAGFAAVLLFVPPIVALYNWRYQLVAMAPLAAAAAFGAQGIAARFRIVRLGARERPEA